MPATDPQLATDDVATAFHRRGELLLVGIFTDPFENGSMSVFATRDAAERFVEGDPFRLNGVVSAWTIKEWHDPYLPALVRDRRGRP